MSPLDNRGIDFAGICASNPIADVVGRYIELRRAGSELKGLCPFHKERTPSFAVNPVKGKGFCGGCGWVGDVIDFVSEYDGLSLAEAARRLSGGQLPVARPEQPAPRRDETPDWTPILPAPADNFDPRSVYNPTRGRRVNWADCLKRQDAYRDASGAVLGYVCRLEVDGQKVPVTAIYARHADGHTDWISAKFPDPRPLQGLDQLAARLDARVLVVSGEKCQGIGASTLPSFVVVTWPGGDKVVKRADWSPLKGRHVTFWPDADDSCRAAVEIAAGLCGGAKIRMLDVTDIEAEHGKGADIADLVEAGWNSARIAAWARGAVHDWVPTEPEPPNGGPDEPTPPVQYMHDMPPEIPYRDTSLDHSPSPASREITATEVMERQTLERAGRVAMLEQVSDQMSAAMAEAMRPALDDLEQAMSLYESAPPGTGIADLPGQLLELTAENMPLPALYSETLASALFARDYESGLRFVSDWGKWMLWDGAQWKADRVLFATDLAKQFCVRFARKAVNDEHQADLTAAQIRSVSARYCEKRTIMNVAELAKSDRKLAASTEQWDADIWALNTPAGVVELDTGNIRPGRREDYMTKLTNVSPGGPCNTWLKFLDSATGGDAELIGFLKRMAGYCLTGSTRDHALFFVYGTGGNGKGTFLNTIQWILGDYNQTASMDVFVEKKHDSHPTELASLMGARLVAAQETEKGKRWAEARIKALTGGDPITARFMHKDGFTFIPQFKLVIAGNHKPGLRNVDEAIRRRLYLIPFTVTIGAKERDARLPDKLKAEASGILQWMIEGCIEWQRDGLNAPAAVKAATEEYLRQQDTLGNWLEDCCDIGPEYSCKSMELYASFKAWMENRNDHPPAQKHWANDMENRKFVVKKSHGVMVYKGIDLKSDATYPQGSMPYAD